MELPGATPGAGGLLEGQAGLAHSPRRGRDPEAPCGSQSGCRGRREEVPPTPATWEVPRLLAGALTALGNISGASCILIF